MSRAMVELDFFAMEKHKPPCNELAHNQRNTVKDIQKAMSRIDPQVLKTMFAKGGVDRKLPEPNMSPGADGGMFHHECVVPAMKQTTRPTQFPVRNFVDRNVSENAAGSVLPLQKIQTGITRGSLERAKETPFESCTEIMRSVWKGAKGSAPLTIFYNGTVSVFDVSPDKAERIIKFSEEVNAGGVESTDPCVSVCSNGGVMEPSENATSDMPMTRRNSLMRFLEKRRERLISSSPYTMGPKDRR